MDARAFLEQGMQLERWIRVREAQIQRLRDRLTSIRSCCPTGMPRGGKRGDWTEAVAMLEDETRTLATSIVDLQKTRSEIRAVIDRVERPLDRMVLESRYLGGNTWPQVAADVGSDERNVYRVHKRALVAAQAVMDREDVGS